MTKAVLGLGITAANTAYSSSCSQSSHSNEGGQKIGRLHGEGRALKSGLNFYERAQRVKPHCSKK